MTNSPPAVRWEWRPLKKQHIRLLQKTSLQGHCTKLYATIFPGWSRLPRGRPRQNRAHSHLESPSPKLVTRCHNPSTQQPNFFLDKFSTCNANSFSFTTGFRWLLPSFYWVVMDSWSSNIWFALCRVVYERAFLSFPGVPRYQLWGTWRRRICKAVICCGGYRTPSLGTLWGS